MKKIFLRLTTTLVFVFLISVAFAQDCPLKLDLEKGTANGVKPTSNWADSKSALGCINRWIETKDNTGSRLMENTIAGITWDLDMHYFIINKVFLSEPLLPFFGKNKKEMVNLLGKPKEELKVDKDFVILFYEKSYGTLVIDIEEGSVYEVYITHTNLSDTKKIMGL
jgi:hypothetical protein